METTNIKTYRYFLYSKSQHQMRTKVDKQIKRVFVPGKVLSSGEWVTFTEISSKPTNSFADAKIVAQGYIEDMKYQNNSSIWGAQ